MKKTTRGRLRIHRETFRTLSDARLARVAGGDFILAVGLQANFVGNGDTVDEPLPRSNGWTTSGSIAVPTC